MGILSKERERAITKILTAATKQSSWRNKKYYRRHLHQAVCVVRANKLVSDKVLIAAGFNPTKRTNGLGAVDA